MITTGSPSIPSGRRLADLSRRAVARAAVVALHHARTGRPADAGAVTALLYNANSLPMGPRSRADYHPRQIDQLLSRSTRQLTGYTRCRTGYWQAWIAEAEAPYGDPLSRYIHKVYVSPLAACLESAVTAVAGVGRDCAAYSFKVGGTTAGVLRADKIVMYFDSSDAADLAAQGLAERLGPMPAQGVPFSGQVGPTGIVSRGADRNGLSWRLMVCQLIADSLVRQAGAAGAAEPTPVDQLVQLALADARRSGLDTDTFAPGRSVGIGVTVP